jgi:ribosomal protein L11 methyltransferase
LKAWGGEGFEGWKAGRLGRLQVPYRIDVRCEADDACDRLIELGALDVEIGADGDIAAVMPDSVAADAIATAFDGARITVSAAVSRDDGSVWVLRPRACQIAGLEIVPIDQGASPDALRLVDATAFGTGMHPTTALCLAAIAELIAAESPEAMLDVGTGSGVLALAALKLGVPRATAIDVDAAALAVAAENARINGLSERLELRHGGPDSLTDTWPLVAANVLAAPLIEMAPAIVRRVASRGHVVLSGIPGGLAAEVSLGYRAAGLVPLQTRTSAGWRAVVFRASW